MFLAFVAVALVASAPLFGGQLSRVGDLRFRGVPVLVGALALQVVVISVWQSPDPAVAAGLHVFTYALAAVFLWWNRRIVGVPLVALGAALNGVAITVNGGTLPASGAAVARSGFHVAQDHFANSGTLVHPHLAFLGDVFVTPAFLPFRNVYSVGDVVIVLGAAICLHVVSGSRLVDPTRLLAACVLQPVAPARGRHRRTAGAVSR
jgi:hypothetical protein